MNKREVHFFRWLCKQADYNYKDTCIYYTKIPIYHTFNNGTTITSWQPGNVVNIYFSKRIEELIAIYDVKYNVNCKYTLALCNKWLRAGIIVKDYNYDEICRKYYLAISVPGRNSRYYNIIPYRVINFLGGFDSENSLQYYPSYEYFLPKVDRVEKMYLRYLIRHADIEASDHIIGKDIFEPVESYNFIIKDYHNLFEKFTSNSSFCSKNRIKRIVKKWLDKGIIFNMTNDNNIKCIHFEYPKDARYIKAIPEKIYKQINKNET